MLPPLPLLRMKNFYVSRSGMILPAETGSFAPPSCPVWRCSLVMGCLVRVMALPELDPVVPVIIVTVGCLQNIVIRPEISVYIAEGSERTEIARGILLVRPSAEHSVYDRSDLCARDRTEKKIGWSICRCMRSVISATYKSFRSWQASFYCTLPRSRRLGRGRDDLPPFRFPVRLCAGAVSC